MKIVYVNTLFGENAIGGAEKICYMLANAMMTKGHQVTVIALHNKKDIEVDSFMGINVIYIPLRNIYWPFSGLEHGKTKKTFWHILDAWNFRMRGTFNLIINHLKPDIIHYHNLSGFSGSIIQRAGIKQLITLHDYYFKCYKSTMFKHHVPCERQCLDCKLITYPRKIASQNIRFTTSVSEFLNDVVCSNGYFSKSRNLVIHNTVKGISIDNGPIESQNKLRFGYIGRLTEEKGFNSLLDVFNRLSSIRTDWTLDIAGNGELEKLIDLSDNNIRYRGFIDIEDFFKDIDILIVPSIWNDPYPTVILEAFSSNIPVLGRRRGGITEILSSSSLGYLFDSDDDMLENLIIFLKSKKEISSKKDNSFLNTTLSQRDWINRYESLYKEMLEDTN